MGSFSSKTHFPHLEPVPNCQTNRIMGTWFVIAVKPTVFETTCSNAVETYTRMNIINNNNDIDKKASYDIDIDFQYNKSEAITSPLKSMHQRGWIQGSDKENSSNWKISPFAFIQMPYPIIELDNTNYEWLVVGHEGRSYAWIMARKPVMDGALMTEIKQRLVEKHGYDLDGMRDVPQIWTRDERAKRKLESVISDEYLRNDL